MGGIGFVNGIVGLGSLAFLFYILLGVGFATTVLARIPWYIILGAIVIFLMWLFRK